jgi:hypothetical protein
MSILNNVDDLAAKEREIRRLEELITVLSSLNDEELAKNWPRIVAARESLKKFSPHAPVLDDPPIRRAVTRQLSPGKLFRLVYRFQAMVSKARLAPKQRVSEIVPEWPPRG